MFGGAQRRETSRSRLDPPSALRRSNVLRLVFDTAALRARDCVPHPLLITPVFCMRAGCVSTPIPPIVTKLGLLAWTEFVEAGKEGVWRFYVLALIFMRWPCSVKRRPARCRRPFCWFYG